MRKKSRYTSGKLNNLLCFFAGALTVGIIGIIAVGAQTKNADAQTTPPLTESVEQQEESTLEKWQEGVVSYNGKNYRFDSGKEVYLLMGIDSDDIVQTAVDYVHGGQSDAMFLLITDKEDEELSVISINRNTMTEVALCDEQGASLGKLVSQICVQHAFGDGKRLSCVRAKEAVEKLFYNIPISGYLSINMGGVPGLNDAIGGVEVQVLPGLSYESSGLQLTEGETVTLDGQMAYRYIRGRDIKTFDSATDRLRRQEQYVINYMNKLKSVYSTDTTAISRIYQAVGDYVVSDVDFVSLAEQMLDYEFDENNLYTVPGETKIGESGYEEYYVNQDEFYDLIIQLFYNEVP